MSDGFDIREAHAAIREANGPGRVEFLFDRGLALARDIVERIGLCVVPETPRWKAVEGTVVRALVRNGRLVTQSAGSLGELYRVLVDERARDVMLVDPAKPLMMPMPEPKRRDPIDEIEWRYRLGYGYKGK